MKPDKWYVSYRTYAAILSLVWLILRIMNVDVPQDTQNAIEGGVKQLIELADAAIPVIVGLLAGLSKIKELIKAKG